MSGARTLKSVPAVKDSPVTIPHDPVRLAPIPWGMEDAELAAGVCRNLIETTPPIEIPLNVVNNAKVRAWLRTHSIAHD